MPGFCRPNSWAWLMWTQLASIADAVADLDADAELGLEQDAAAEVDLVVERSWNFAGRAGVDGDAEAGTDVQPRRRTSPTGRPRRNWCRRRC